MTPASDPKALPLQISAYAVMEREQCLDLWRRQFGQKAPRYISLALLRKVLAFEAQIKAIGGYPLPLRQALTRIPAQTAKKNSTPRSSLRKASPLLRPGTHLVREYQGHVYKVEVLENGFSMDGKTYRSLSAIAVKITGTRWSGPRFFGLA